MHAHRERERNRLSVEESEKLYLDEISNLQDRVSELENRLSFSSLNSIEDVDFSNTEDDISCLIGPEIYSGETSDRIRYAADIALKYADQLGIDKRSIEIFRVISNKLSVSPALVDLKRDLKRATTDPRRVASELTGLLGELGYAVKSENRHVRLEADENYLGLEAITLPKTPSDSRGLKNLRKQIERTLGITKLPDQP
nr:hypothetical protein [Marinicella sp. W31]MDC2877168.1 hypothetical protein [Marinicella sp. W31]